MIAGDLDPEDPNSRNRRRRRRNNGHANQARPSLEELVRLHIEKRRRSQPDQGDSTAARRRSGRFSQEAGLRHWIPSRRPSTPGEPALPRPREQAQGDRRPNGREVHSGDRRLGTPGYPATSQRAFDAGHTQAAAEQPAASRVRRMTLPRGSRFRYRHPRRVSINSPHL